MSASNDSPGLSRAERRVQDALDGLHQQRAEFRRALRLNQISRRMHLRFEQAVLDVYEELLPYRDEVEEEWVDAMDLDSGLDALPELAARTRSASDVVVQNGVPQRTVSTEPVMIPPQTLLTASYELDGVADELGFGTEIEQETPHDEASKDDLRELLDTREQEEALDSAPSGDT